jgi:hypothetical protein
LTPTPACYAVALNALEKEAEWQKAVNLLLQVRIGRLSERKRGRGCKLISVCVLTLYRSPLDSFLSSYQHLSPSILLGYVRMNLVNSRTLPPTLPLPHSFLTVYSHSNYLYIEPITHTVSAFSSSLSLNPWHPLHIPPVYFPMASPTFVSASVSPCTPLLYCPVLLSVYFFSFAFVGSPVSCLPVSSPLPPSSVHRCKPEACWWTTER